MLRGKVVHVTEKGVEYAIYIKEHFITYLDYCFIILCALQGDIKEFHSILNSLHRNHKFTIECSETEMPFLHMLVKLENNQGYLL